MAKHENYQNIARLGNFNCIGKLYTQVFSAKYGRIQGISGLFWVSNVLEHSRIIKFSVSINFSPSVLVAILSTKVMAMHNSHGVDGTRYHFVGKIAELQTDQVECSRYRVATCRPNLGHPALQNWALRNDVMS